MIRNKSIWLIGFIGLILTSFTVINVDKVIDFLSIGEQIEFDGEKYNLKWSSNPSTNYYKQEYLRESDNNLNNYHKMMIIEAIKGDLTVDQAAGVKIQELENWKKKNPVVNYLKFDNKDTKETMIDFVVSDGAYIYEWNLYRYQQQKNKKDKYMVLYAYSYRDSLNDNNDLKEFFGHIKENRINMINKIGKLDLPKVKTKK
jgi:hypothetical protein